MPLHNPHCTPEKNPQSSTPSVFKETPLTPEQIANNLRDEIKRLKRRRQFAGPQSPGSPTHDPPSPVSAPSSPEPMMDLEQPGSSTGKVEKPIFTLKQMTMIAERMCEERVEQVRAEYDNILQQKLSEQVNPFVKIGSGSYSRSVDRRQLLEDPHHPESVSWLVDF